MPNDRGEEFVRLLGQHHRRVFVYILALVPNHGDAEEILQETNLVLWREFATFTLGTNFAAWACRVALNQVLAWRKRRQRDRLQFSEAFLETVAAEVDANAERLEERAQLLAQCLEKLPRHHRTLVQLRYTEGRDIESIAAALQRSSDAVYRALSRARRTLHECVSRTLATQR